MNYLRRDVKTNSSQVQFLVSVNTGNYEEYSRALTDIFSGIVISVHSVYLGSSRPQSPKSEYYRSLVLLHDLRICRHFNYVVFFKGKFKGVYLVIFVLP